LRQYLLGQLAGEDEEKVELHLLTDPDYSEELDVIVDELIDQYVEGELATEERERLEQHFFKSQDRVDKLKFALALKRHKSKLRSDERRTRRFSTFYLPIAASILIVAGLSIGIWQMFFYQSDLNKGLVALQTAYRDRRPIEARISGLNYAPAATRRGGPDTVNYLQRDLAASLLLKAVSDNPSATSHHALGKYYLADQQFDKAINEFNAALSLEPRNARIHADLGAALLEEGKAHGSEADQGKQVEDFGKSLGHLNNALELDHTLLEALFNRALLHQYMRLSQQAEEDWRKYLEQDPNSKWADEARQNLKLLEEQQKQTTQSKEEIFQRFLRNYESRDDEATWGLVSSYHNRTGNVIVEQLLDAHLEEATKGQKEEAGRNLHLLLYVGELERGRAGDRFFSDLATFYKSARPEQQALLAQARELMKKSYDGWGRFQVSENLDLFSKAKQLFEEAGDVCESKVAEYWMSFCYYHQHNQEQSRKILEPLISACENKDYTWLRVRGLYLLSAIHFNLNEHSKAVDFAQRSVELAEKTNDTVGLLNAVSALIEYYRYLGNYRKSLSYIQRSLPLISSISLDPIQGARHYGFVAVAFASVGLFAAAADYQREALQFALSTRADAAISYNYAFLGMINGKLGNFSEALQNVQLAFAIAQSHSNEAADRSLMAYSSLQMGNIYRQEEDFDQAVASYTQSIELYEKLEFPNHLYEAHKGRLLCYVAQKNDQLAREEIATTLKLIEKYRKEIYEENNRNTFFDVEQSVYDTAIDFEYSRLGDPQQAFQYLESSRARSLQDLLNADAEVLAKVRDPDIIFHSVSQPLTLEEIQQQLPSQAQILQYAVLENKLLIWVISKSKISIIAKEVTQKELNEKVASYLQIISAASEADREEVLRRAKDLFTILISPVESLLERDKETCIIPDKMLNYLSFAALVSPSSGKYLIEDHLLVFSQSPSVFVLCSKMAVQKEGAKDERLLSVGNPRFDQSLFPSLPDLPSASREAVKVAAYYNPSLYLIEGQARPESVKSEMERADVIHLALHSLLDDGVPLRSKLLLAKASTEIVHPQSSESVLYAYEIYNLKLSQARLVVLSACQTGAERYYSGEGMSSLARPFIVAGVPLVVASLWPVDSDSTAELMISFHRHRRSEGLSTAEALRSAQLDMLRSPEGRYHQPYYWAPFTVIGGYANF
jgi:CHAT domain-containing protein/lipoprotein NlpI